MSSKGTSHKVARDRITAKRSHTRDTRKPRKTQEARTKPPNHSDTYAHQSGNQSIPDKQTPPLAHTKPKPTTHTLKATNWGTLSGQPPALPSGTPKLKNARHAAHRLPQDEPRRVRGHAKERLRTPSDTHHRPKCRPHAGSNRTVGLPICVALILAVSRTGSTGTS